MAWRAFAPTIAAAIPVWIGAWGLGQASTSLLEWLGIAIFVVICGISVTGWLYFHRHEDELEAKADKALPRPLPGHCPSDLKPTMPGR